MKTEDIARRVKLHNGLQIFQGVGLIPSSIFLWWVSFWFFRLAFYLPLRFFMNDAWTTTLYLAWLCMIPLAIEGVRRTRPLFDLGDYARSGFYDNFIMQSDTGAALSRYYGQPLAAAYLVSQLLYSAPRTAVLAIKALRSRLPTNDAVISDASRILSELRKTRKWIPAENYKEYGTALLLLDGLHLIWTENKTGQVEIRYPAGKR